MLGLVVHGKFMGRVKMLQYGGVKFLTVPVCAGKGVFARVTARRAVRRFVSAGISCALFPKDYPFMCLFAVRGILPPDITALQQAAAAQIARAELGGGRDERRVVLVSETLTQHICIAAESLCRSVRYLAFDLPSSGAALYRHLRRSYGVAPEICTPEQGKATDLVLLFSKMDGWEQAEGKKIPLYDPTLAEKYVSFPALESGDFESMQMLAALFSAGVLERESICVRKRVSEEKREKLTEP